MAEHVTFSWKGRHSNCPSQGRMISLDSWNLRVRMGLCQSVTEEHRVTVSGVGSIEQQTDKQ